MALLKTLVLKGQHIAQESVIPLLARISLAATFWLSGQSKVVGLNIDILETSTPWQLGIPRVTDSSVSLFISEYKLPLLPPDVAAVMAATAEHLFPLLLIVGLATRFSALALMVMTLVIQIFVYPDAWPVHATWLTAQLYLMTYGGGRFSLDRLIYRHRT
ncbi:DoxX family protein [Photorhabdus noenieputensis]|uniref:DoxX family protein n=1 Tax=Photorhabdus noenieputensis TaxID=1208607 RepID=UPI001BD211E8|nr:DoxX family protein [Photorhabdus noenieputensis]MBS9439481.1 DoxX family protein [Photorhabdus noenieputensis]MCK3669612.1 DoxX family protein [Photorhabdus noenieputensis]